MSADQLSELLAAGAVVVLLVVVVILLTRQARALGDVRALLTRLVGPEPPTAERAVDAMPDTGRRAGRTAAVLADGVPADGVGAEPGTVERVGAQPAATGISPFGIGPSGIGPSGVRPAVASAPGDAGNPSAVGTGLVRAEGPSLSEVAAATLGPPLVRAAALGYGIRTVLADRARPRPGRQGLFGTSLGATGTSAERERARRRAGRGRR